MWEVWLKSLISNNMIQTMTNHPFGNGFYRPFMFILGMVYHCLNHIREIDRVCTVAQVHELFFYMSLLTIWIFGSFFRMVNGVGIY